MLRTILATSIACLLFKGVSCIKCRTVPSDAAWPSTAVWNAFNSSVQGRLIHTVPIGTPCHGEAFDAAQCQSIQDGWHTSMFHSPSDHSLMAPLFANQSCDPFNSQGASCIIGTYVEYSVNVSTPAHVITTMQFARTHNLRLVIRNTGHDLLGKSTGHGALSLWMHHVTGIQFIDNYKSNLHSGPAVKVNAGVLAVDLYNAVHSKGLMVVAGSGCPDVGFAGGFIQGGGHSPLSNLYGMAADQTLELEVITPQGKFVTASPTQNSDLYWAMSGGGGSSYGVLWSVTVITRKELPVTGAVISFAAGGNVSLDTWYSGLAAYHSNLPRFTDAGAYALALFSEGVFQLAPLFAVGKTQKEVTDLIGPFVSSLDSLGIPHNTSIIPFDNFLSGFTELFPAIGVGLSQVGSRLLPRLLFTTSNGKESLNTAVRSIVSSNATVLNFAVHADKQHASNAVLPAWRTAQSHFITNLPWDDRASIATALEQRNIVTDIWGATLRKISPDSGAYLNEADSAEPDWQVSFYGVNYPKLLAIKDRWDPDQLLYAPTAVGSERWVQRSDGRLCTVH